MKSMPALFERLGFDARTLRILWTLLAAYLVWILRDVLFLFVVAVLVAYALLPVVDVVDRRLERGRKRPLALALVYLLIVGVIATVAGTIGFYAAQQARALFGKVHEIVSAGQWPEWPLPDFVKPFAGEAVTQAREWLKDHAQEILRGVSQVTLRLLGALGNLFNVVIVLLLSFFFLKDGQTIKETGLNLLSAESRERGERIIAEINAALQQYIRSMVLVALITATLYGIGLSLLGVPYALLLAVVALPFEFIPMVGPLLSTSLILLVNLLGGGPGLGWVLIFILAVRAVQDYGLQPYLMGAGLELTPLSMMFAVFAGQALGGIAGALLAVPGLAIGRILLRHALGSADPPPPPVAPPPAGS